jgi:drug/metabolite transporter (DMT)-like permease
VVITFASYLVWFWLVRHYPATRISAFTLLTPVFGLLAGVLLLGEPLTPRLVIALAAVCGGLLLVNHAPRRIPVPPTTLKETTR